MFASAPMLEEGRILIGNHEAIDDPQLMGKINLHLAGLLEILNRHERPE